MTLQHLCHGTTEGRGAAMTLTTAYKIAAVLDPDHREDDVSGERSSQLPQLGAHSAGASRRSA